MTDTNTIKNSNSIERTSTALVFDLADGQTVELTAHVQTSRDDGLRGMDPVDVDSQTQAYYKAGPATLGLRDVGAEDDDPIGLLPVTKPFGVTPPLTWRGMDADEVRKRITTDIELTGPVFEHESGEAWLRIERKYMDGVPTYRVWIESGDPSGGIHPRVEEHHQAYSDALLAVEQMLQDHHDGATHD